MCSRASTAAMRLGVELGSSAASRSTRRCRRRVAGLGDQRPAATAPARLSAAPARPRLVRHGQRQMAVANHCRRPAVLGAPAVVRLQAAPDGGRRGRAAHAHAAPGASDPSRHPRFPTRQRTLGAGHCTLEGRAWSGFAPIARVEVSTDDGASWGRPSSSRTSTRLGVCRWEQASRRGLAKPARLPGGDASGRIQPLEPVWNLSGYANNAVQRVPVTIV